MKLPEINSEYHEQSRKCLYTGSSLWNLFSFYASTLKMKRLPSLAKIDRSNLHSLQACLLHSEARVAKIGAETCPSYSILPALSYCQSSPGNQNIYKIGLIIHLSFSSFNQSYKWKQCGFSIFQFFNFHTAWACKRSFSCCWPTGAVTRCILTISLFTWGETSTSNYIP